MHFNKEYAKLISEQLNETLPLEEVENLIETPKHEKQGDLAFPCFILAKKWRKSPQHIAKELMGKLQSPLFEQIIAEGPYINAFLHKETVNQQVLKQIMEQGRDYGSWEFGNGKNTVIDFSSPNIAKPFSMGHLRSTVIGNALANIAEKCGFKTIRINHLGDWGTQFGKLIVAYKRWGSEEQVKRNPIKELLSLYVQFHTEAEKDQQLEEEARRWFKKLEDGDEEAQQLWLWFRKESLHEFTKIYDLLHVHFDSYHGEAFYNDKMEETVKKLIDLELLERSDGAQIVDLKEFDLPPCLIQKSDGATLYATRDLTAALYRYEQYHFEKAFYVVGQEQSLHFQQVFRVLEKMGYTWAKSMTHIPFGFILKNGKKMSTRKGKVVLLEAVIEEAIKLAKQNIEEKNPHLPMKDAVAHMVGVGAIIFHDLKHEKQNHIEFSLEEMLKFEGNTGPYVQYTYARACSILRKAEHTEWQESITGHIEPEGWAIVKQLMLFPTVIQTSFYRYEPSEIAKYLFQLAQNFNKYYAHVKILHNGPNQADRLALVKAITIVLEEGLHLLGIEAPKQM
ncbi:arginine--tRNA ligase [Lederbergia sp. NSJ-179]|uniref:arginine--tRNA ligase n=1 Tax=Lederbergia sp. NSJ-179 TaxID=2931402 RepID=UPI001FD1C406|nr:arginine--tRNA ligase [Lederbergia sp. NSJ-179]MCJ7842012.1 arginine--tRNA ligase [Lederbergia sp. NSJ-179]